MKRTALIFLLGLAGVIAAGLFWGPSSSSAAPPQQVGPVNEPSLGLALVFVLYAFGGWKQSGQTSKPYVMVLPIDD